MLFFNVFLASANRRARHWGQTRIMGIHERVTREVDRAPAGPETVAFFDMDGTLIFGFSIAALFRERVQSGNLHPREAVASFHEPRHPGG